MNDEFNYGFIEPIKRFYCWCDCIGIVLIVYNNSIKYFCEYIFFMFFFLDMYLLFRFRQFKNKSDRSIQCIRLIPNNINL